jgi:ubiquinone/menaquinone biosynthesis C-methylase UbiE
VGWWHERVVPRIVDKALGTKQVRELRGRVCAGMSGDLVEIGFGSGLNVAHYANDVTGVWAVEPSDVAWSMAQEHVAGSPVPVRRAGLDGQALELPDDRFDTALSTFSLCTIPDVDAALAEVRRVLRPGGSLHFLEHGRSPDASVARWQDRLQPFQFRLAGGCHLDRPITELVERSGLVVEQLETFYAAGPKPLAYLFLGRARKVS